MIKASSNRILRISLVAGVVSGCVVVIAHFLRQVGGSFNPVLWASAEIIAALLGFTIAANILVRYHGTADRLSLFLGAAFGLDGLIQVSGLIELHGAAASRSAAHVPVYWMAGGTLLGVLLLGAIGFDNWLPWPRESKRTVLAVLSVVAAAAALTGLVFLGLGGGPAIHNSRFLPRPWDLLPALIFLTATILLYRSPYRLNAALGTALPWVAGVNAAGHLVATQSAQLLDAPALLAQILTSASYVIVLGATLIDNIQLFGQVRHRAISDSLTGLANYRRFIEALQSELERSGRTNRQFSVLLMDLDKLKEINDRFGHQTGTRAICRVADVLRQHCRAVDTAARYGGDEFSLLLPETGETAARRVASRIKQHLQADNEEPKLTVSIGVATHPAAGVSVQHLLECADQELYAQKASRGRKAHSREL
ncbi:MAG TPA: GGDEF domain-containing protein [Candidatus Acidoferrales bacterium]|jgi:diguanylate cyclase (GGDEF)-like protein|nr:GGDEF domain-containing protein [Candidatus Acidoferrales bacterium]